MSWTHPHPTLSDTDVARLRNVFGLLTALPWAFALALYAYAATAAIEVGHLPTYNRPDPKQLDMPWAHAAVMGAFGVSLVGIIVWLLWAPFFGRALGVKTVVKHLALVAAAVVLSLVDPLGFFGWYAD